MNCSSFFVFEQCAGVLAPGPRHSVGHALLGSSLGPVLPLCRTEGRHVQGHPCGAGRKENISTSDLLCFITAGHSVEPTLAGLGSKKRVSCRIGNCRRAATQSSAFGWPKSTEQRLTIAEMGWSRRERRRKAVGREGCLGPEEKASAKGSRILEGLFGFDKDLGREESRRQRRKEGKERRNADRY